jgi:hypothetical protein
MHPAAWSNNFNTNLKNGIMIINYQETFDNLNWIASCGPNQVFDLAGVKMNSKTFTLTINTKYAGTYNGTQWTEIITHELGHALGIGAFWNNIGSFNQVVPINNFLDGNSYSKSQQAYNGITGLVRQKIPLERSGTVGTADGHWENQYRSASSAGSLGVGYPGLSNELMIGYYSPSQVISSLSVNALVDFGYIEINPGTNEGTPSLSTGVSILSDGAVKLNCCMKNSALPKIEKINIIKSSFNIDLLSLNQSVKVSNFIIKNK